MTTAPAVKCIEVLPWQRETLRRIQRLERDGHLPQTLVLQAAAGTGLLQFAETLSGWLLCHARDAQDAACGKCSACRQWQVGNHPDTLQLWPEGAAQEITVDQVRACTEMLSLARHHQGYRIVQLYPAERLNRNASNAMLKTLEEPGAGTVFLLLSEQPRNLLPTIRSRAQVVTVPPPSDEQAHDWLRAQGIDDAEARLEVYPGQPLRALDDDDQETARQFGDLLQQLERAPSELTATAKRVAATKEDALRFIEWLATGAWREASSSLTEPPSVGLDSVMETYQLTLQARGALRANTPPQLAVESLLVSWLAIKAQSRKRDTGGPRGRNR